MIGNYVVQPKGKQKLLMPTTLDDKDQNCRICFINDTNRYLTIMQNHCIGVAESMDSLLDERSLAGEQSVDDYSPTYQDVHVRSVTITIPELDVLGYKVKSDAMLKILTKLFMLFFLTVT